MFGQQYLPLMSSNAQMPQLHQLMPARIAAESAGINSLQNDLILVRLCAQSCQRVCKKRRIRLAHRLQTSSSAQLPRPQQPLLATPVWFKKPRGSRRFTKSYNQSFTSALTQTNGHFLATRAAAKAFRRRDHLRDHSYCAQQEQTVRLSRLRGKGFCQSRTQKVHTAVCALRRGVVNLV
uniref:Uncharacterized protein n=1 Tax=Macrostomum lignano TaxID=282301 RepID=A0A1I8FDX1_9PLAT